MNNIELMIAEAGLDFITDGTAIRICFPLRLDDGYVYGHQLSAPVYGLMQTALLLRGYSDVS